ncbi:MAG: hypothetical protein VX265_06190 [Myxococcota bacterium]|nr:hypothetical protein [Myxococcota bacterium]
MHRLRLVCFATLLGCGGATEPDGSGDDPCAGPGALSDCLAPTRTMAYYAEKSSAYFDTMDKRVEPGLWPPYGETVARWEWPPWLKLTAYGRDNIEASDTLLRAYPSIVEERDCRGFDTQPFGRCRVVFYYDDALHEGRGCPIYEEFVFNDDGEITWIEAWSDQPDMLPMDGGVDPWAEGEDVTRLSSRIPGLGAGNGTLVLDGDAMMTAVASDADVADFHARANDFFATWSAELEAAGDEMWVDGCGW